MKMKIRDSRGFATELLKDLIFPAKCPICSEPLPLEKRAAMHAERTREMQVREVKMQKGHTQEAQAEKMHLQETYMRKMHTPQKAPERDFSLLYDGLICGKCRNSFSMIREPYCGKCGKQLEKTKESGLCSDCEKHERLFKECRCLISYDETARELMAEIKYNSKKELLDIFPVMAADRLGDWIESRGADCIVPVPIHKQRMRKRGYNQAGIFAKELGKLTNIPVREDILVRSRNTAAQKELGAEDRLLNLQSAFSAVKKIKKGTKILLADDIYTTGSTMEACAEILLEAGADTIYGICICAGADH